MLSSVEHEQSFTTSGPEDKTKSAHLLYIYEETVPRAISGHHRPINETPFELCFAGGPMMAHFGLLTGVIL